MSKLVRDKIPEIIAKNDGIIPSIHIATGKELVEALDTKLDEEIGELRDAPDAPLIAEEIADVIEVLLAIAHFRGFSSEQIEAIRLGKKAKR